MEFKKGGNMELKNVNVTKEDKKGFEKKVKECKKKSKTGFTGKLRRIKNSGMEKGKMEG